MLLRNFWNTLKRYKTASILNIIGLSIAFSAFTIIMIQVRYDLTYDTFHSKHERIFRGETRATDPFFYSATINRPLLRHIEETYPEVEATVLLRRGSDALVTTDPVSEQYTLMGAMTYTTPDILKVFDFRIIEGDASAFKRPRHVIISESQARQLFPDEPAAGRLLKPHGERDSVFYEIVAVYQDFPENSYLKNSIYTIMGNEYYNNKGSWNYENFILLKNSNQKEKVQQEIEEYIQENYGKTGAQWEGVSDLFRLTSLQDTHYAYDVKGDDIEKTNKRIVYTLILIAILIIVIAMINFINFSISLVPARIQGVNTRKVLGESLSRMRWGVIFEGVTICFIAMLLSVGSIYLLSDSSLASMLTINISISNNFPILLGTFFIALATGLIASILPAFNLTSYPPALVLKGSFGLTPRGKKLRTILISFQYIICFILIILSIFIHVQNNYLRKFPIGFEKENVLVGSIWEEILSREEAFIERLRQNPAIKEVAFNEGGLIVAESAFEWGVEHKEGMITFRAIPVSKDFIQTLGIRISEGRNFREEDFIKPNGVFIFNQTAKKQFGLELNEIINHWGNPTEIIGFTEDFNFRPLHYPIGPIVFHYADEQNRSTSTGYFRVDAHDISSTIDYIMEVIREMDPAHAELTDLRFFDERIGRLYQREERMAAQITIFSLFAILISLIGVFGLILFETQYRRKEIGVRKIHGASIAEILSMLNLGFIKILLACFVIAIPVAYYAISRWLDNFTYKAAISVWIFVVAFLIVSLITILTVTLQSWRTATENPVNAIKSE